jgi:hypothetical protein
MWYQYHGERNIHLNSVESLHPAAPDYLLTDLLESVEFSLYVVSYRPSRREAIL